ncbi:hypothetical protein M6B38_322585 [Iris pallida]|uniref:Uncharacterized protein n=1 Tax=Iris pallida TaxID=29817 RepID=A0AAX6HB79_IRIPA|nr:hypothetical protein M6B38_377140 [Iris pallida]KAJ6838103.1 hypothetical protein M6B38_322585 [Iris pallida]
MGYTGFTRFLTRSRYPPFRPRNIVNIVLIEPLIIRSVK